MMKSRKFFMTAGLALSMTFGVPAMPAMAMDTTATASVTEAVAPAPDARMQLDKALDSLSEFKQGTVAFEVEAAMPPLNGTVKGNLAFVAESLMNAKGSVNVEMAVSGIPAAHVDRLFYLQESENNFTCYYQKEDNTWAKSVIEKKEDSDKAGSESDSAFERDFVSMIKSVQLGTRTENNQTYLVTMDGDKLYPYLAQLLDVKTTGKEAKKDVLNQALANLGDLSYEITIDEGNHLLTDVHADLTEPLRRAGEAAVKNGKLSKKEKKEILEVIHNSTLEINFHGKNLEQAPDVTVPAEVSSTAKEELPHKVADLKQNISQ